jgi:hypothetical protein
MSTSTLKNIESLAAKETSSDVDKLVDKVMQIYRQEDYDFVVSLAKEGKKPQGIKTIAGEIEFIKRNELAKDMSDSNIRKAASIIQRKIKALNAEIYENLN